MHNAFACNQGCFEKEVAHLLVSGIFSYMELHLFVFGTNVVFSHDKRVIKVINKKIEVKREI
jgi:hypothetical protein